ncbi:5'-deoxynucleotidase [Paenibacillus sp. UMB4589-SE434]|uniref:5'-deoxynucleotidase n=1 Tax=Paenibacillus sp. UMB4589-SE434 TaxID=3046314 RepID=UPI00254C5466|nr:5'-deoxynucleotidase [Paenibacillus sp. UMB4589-SE434]MDK8182348.1 5'-deoxynucleotidase [Paenibacillus sp. UMB4589-SE434]
MDTGKPAHLHDRFDQEPSQHNHFYAYMYRLKHIERWSLMRNTTKENVAEHSFHVALTTHVLCTIANEIFHREVDTNLAVSMALFHDATEVFTGDIPTPVKHHNPRILANFREIEHLAAERLVDMIPPALKSIYTPLIHPTEEHKLRKYVKAADLLDAYLKCTFEIASGNREFVVAKQQIEGKIKLLEMDEVDYFMITLAPSFTMSLDEMSE